MASEPTPGAEAFQRSREKRRGVQRASAELEEALARPAGQDAKVWSANTAGTVQALSEAFANHAQQSEGPGGLLSEILETAPRLAHGVDRVKQEHRDLLDQISALEDRVRGNEDPACIAGIRDEAAGLLRAIADHRQRGADLIYEAYSVDIEGSD